jgi:hypothetical protein
MSMYRGRTVSDPVRPSKRATPLLSRNLSKKYALSLIQVSRDMPTWHMQVLADP